MMKEKVSVRTVARKDKEMLTQIYFETAFLGKHGQPIFDDPTFFFDIGFLYFTKFDTRFSFIAESDGIVLGYILGTPSIRKYFLLNSIFMIPFFLLPRLITFRYKIGWKTLKFMFFLFLDALFQRIPRSPYSTYPAELHINLLESSRGKGIASQLMKHLLDQLQEEHIKGIQLNTTSENRDAIKLYNRFGFKEISNKTSILWSHFLSYPVFSITFAKEI